MSRGAALVTGAAKNIGQAIALRLAKDGFDVARVGRSVESVAETVRGVEAQGRKALAIAADVSHPEEAQAAVDSTTESLGSIDVLVNNAGITRDKLLLRMDESDFDAVLAVNLKGV